MRVDTASKLRTIPSHRSETKFSPILGLIVARLGSQLLCSLAKKEDACGPQGWTKRMGEFCST